MAALDESVLTKMNRRCIIIKYGGHWEGSEYINGDEELLLVPSGGISHACLVEEIHGIIEADQKTTQYLLFCLMEANDSAKVKFRIKNDVDLSYVLAKFNELVLYIILTEEPSTPRHYQNSLTDIKFNNRPRLRTRLFRRRGGGSSNWK